jgi:hypothetical protein
MSLTSGVAKMVLNPLRSFSFFGFPLLLGPALALARGVSYPELALSSRTI